VERFIEENKDFYLEDITEFLPDALRKESAGKDTFSYIRI